MNCPYTPALFAPKSGVPQNGVQKTGEHTEGTKTPYFRPLHPYGMERD